MSDQQSKDPKIFNWSTQKQQFRTFVKPEPVNICVLLDYTTETTDRPTLWKYSCRFICKFLRSSSYWEPRAGLCWLLLTLICHTFPFPSVATMDYLHYWLLNDWALRLHHVKHNDTGHHKHKVSSDCLHSLTCSHTNQNMHFLITYFFVK